MSQLTSSSTVDVLYSAVAGQPNVYRDYLLSKLPTPIKDAPPSVLISIINTQPNFPEWYINARRMNKEYLDDLIDRRWRLQGPLQTTLENLQQDINAFAEPLLVAALKDELQLELDVNTTVIRLYIPAPLFPGIDNNASRMRQSSLLEAALHNFEQPETLAGAFRDGSGIFTLDSTNALQRHELTVEKFATLCRKLDLGAQYQTHIKALLMPEQAAAMSAVAKQEMDIEKAAFKESSFIAYLKNDVSSGSWAKLLQIHQGNQGVLLGNRPLHCHRLSLMGFNVSGVVLFSAVADPSEVKRLYDSLVPQHQRTLMEWSRRLTLLPGQEFDQFKLLKAFFANGPKGLVEAMMKRNDLYEQSRLDGTLLVYVPDDPDHPIKEYDSLADFMKVLLGQLRSPSYQEFFSRFIAHKDKGRFFARVRERLTTYTWTARGPLDMGPWWRETAVENPNAEPITNVIPGDLWPRMGRWRREKAIADARQIAVLTDDEDAATRWNRLTTYLNIGWNVFNFGAMLVPGLAGPLLAVMVGQMLLETMEGIEEWSKGDKEEAAAHLVGVMINAAQLALMMAGHVLPGGTATPVRPSSLIDNLKPVQLPDGSMRLWNKNLVPYAHDIALATDAKPNEQGLFRHSNKDILKHDGQHFEVRDDPRTGQSCMPHPSRPKAYQPKLEHNGAGGWKTELERPLEWDKPTLMRRLGPMAEGLSDATLEQVRVASGVGEDELRRLHVVNQPPPTVLLDTLGRFKAWAEVGNLPEQIKLDQVPQAFIEQMPHLLLELPGWPEHTGIELFEGAEHWGTSIKFGDVDASPANTLKITRAEIRAGKLPEFAVKFMSEADIRAMFGQGISREQPLRINALKNKLAEQAKLQSDSLFNVLNRAGRQTGSPQAVVLQDAFSGLSTAAAEALLADVAAEDLPKITDSAHIPLALQERARVAALTSRVARAYEGLFFDVAYGADTERLALHSLQALPEWPENVRIEIRGSSFDGPLNNSLGPVDADICRVLVSENGKYEARDANDLHLYGPDDLYGSILHALPDAERDALGYQINQGATLKQAVLQDPLPRDRFTALLADNPVRKPHYDPLTMRLRGGMRGVSQGLGQVTGQLTPQVRVRVVRPGWSEAEAEAYLQAGGSDADIEQRASALEAEFNRLNANFQRWLSSPTEAFRYSPAGVAEWQSRNALYKAVRECWQHSGLRDVDSFGNLQGSVLDLHNVPLGRHLNTMPTLEGNFDHVTRLDLSSTELSNIHISFLDHFPRVRSLSANDNLLTRIPNALGRMRALTDLNLRGNQIVMDARGIADLAVLTRLNTLDLVGNPLRTPPDVSRMSLLHTLLLADTRIRSWPSGLFAQPRLRHFYLDLQQNLLTDIPAVPRGSVQAEILARTVVSRDPEFLSADNLQTLRDYIESVGLDPDRPYPPRGVRDSLYWEEGMSRSEWVARQKVWNSVEDETGSVQFFNEIRKLTQSSHYVNDTLYRVDLTAKVWRLLDAMAENTELRLKLFTMAEPGTSCVDAGAQLFNAMGMEVLIHEAYELGNPGLVETELATLARGKGRLDELTRIAHKTVAERLEQGEEFTRVGADGEVQGTIDEVEVHMAFMTDLAERLDLPWQFRKMQFRKIAGVDKAMIDAAYQRVMDLEAGDLLDDVLLDQPFWTSYVEGSNRSTFKGFRRRLDLTTEFYMALEERARGTELSLEQKEQLKIEIRVLGSELKKPESAYAPGTVMTDDEYVAEVKVIEDEMKATLKTITGQAIDRAKLRRVEIPFTVEPAS